MTGFFKIGHRPTLPHFTAVPSALAGLTSLFGMGRGGHRRYRHLNFFWLIGSFVQWYEHLFEFAYPIFYSSVSYWSLCLATNELMTLPDQWTNSNIIERRNRKFEKTTALIIIICLFGGVTITSYTLIRSRRKLRAISITRLWCHHL